MDSQELVAMFEGGVDSREKTLVLFMCATESLPVLTTTTTDQVCDQDEINNLTEIMESVNFLTQKWTEKLQTNQLNSQDYLEMFTESKLLQMLTKLYFEGHSQPFPDLHSIIDQILSTIFVNVDVVQHDQHVPFYLFLAVNAKLFVNTQERHKFDLCERIDRCLQKNLSSSRTQGPIRQSIAMITAGLMDILGSKLSAEFRNRAISLAATLTLGYESLEWIEFTSGSHSVDGRKAFLLLSTLVPIEIRLCLDRQQVQNDLLGKCLVLFEAIFLRLVQSEEEDDDDDGKEEDKLVNQLNNFELISILDRIKSTILVMIEFVCNNVKMEQQDKQSSPSIEQPAIEQQVFPPETLTACIRTLCLYLTEENELLQAEQYERIVLRLLRILDSQTNETEDENSRRMPSEMILTALHSLALTNENVRNLVRQHQHLFERIRQTGQSSLLNLCRDLETVVNEQSS